ncbi:MAG TPA: condensation domain-containing protein, partial [Blastocatellia bacterium]|nr:condensation domain-containing protein [Blastocatellia bacterium]
MEIERRKRLEESRSRLSESKRALLEKRLGPARVDVAGAKSDAPVRDSHYRHLSRSQERIWFFQQLEPLANAFNSVALVRISGRLEIPLLSRSLNDLFQRNWHLRSGFEQM